MHKDQRGFSLIVVLIIIVVTIGGFTAWRIFGTDGTNTNQQPQPQAQTQSEPDIALENLGLASLSSIAINEYAVREYESKGLKGFYVFGDTLSGGRINPNFEYASVTPGSNIIAAIDGIISFVREQPETNDFEITLQPREGSAWQIGYDHLKNISVKQGDRVKAGDVLGEAAVQNNGILRFEMQINKDESGNTTHHCPTTLLAADVKDKYIKELTDMQNAWESKTGLDLYDLTNQNPVGCLTATLTPSQAEGR